MKIDIKLINEKLFGKRPRKVSIDIDDSFRYSSDDVVEKMIIDELRHQFSAACVDFDWKVYREYKQKSKGNNV